MNNPCYHLTGYGGKIQVVFLQTENSIRPVIRILDEENRLTEKGYQLNKNKNVSILQVEN